MDVASLVSSFATGSYDVTRTERGDINRGRAQQGAVSTIVVVASVSPSTGADLKRLPEGRRTNEARTVFTTTQLLVGGQGAAFEADKITIDGETWEVGHVETWRDSASGAVGYRCVATAMR